MPPKPEILLIDEGELDDVRAILEEVGAEYAWLQPKDVHGEIEEPGGLFITTASRAISLRLPKGLRGKERRALRVAVATGSSNTQRSALKRAGFDFLVRRPVHPGALRLFLLHALYHGKEKRKTARFAFGYHVTYRARFKRRSATLVELSAEGCRLLGSSLPQAGTPVSIQLPAEVAGGRALRLTGVVVRQEQASAGNPLVGSTGVRFERMEEGVRERLRSVLEERFWGPAMLPRTSRAPEGPKPRGASERRRTPRACYDAEVLAVWNAMDRTLVGRDLSARGMRVERHPELALGHRVRLAIYADVRDEPILVKASVTRDDGESGLALHFEEIDAMAKAKLENLVRSLPPIESIGTQDGPVFLSEMVPA
jgi:hypothetical protein